MCAICESIFFSANEPHITMNTDPSQITEIQSPSVTVESDFWGSRHIKIDDFCFVTINYRHPYTSNASQRDLVDHITKWMGIAESVPYTHIAPKPLTPPVDTGSTDAVEFSVQDSRDANQILTLLGYSSEESLEPGADRRRDIVAAFLCTQFGRQKSTRQNNDADPTSIRWTSHSVDFGIQNSLDAQSIMVKLGRAAEPTMEPGANPSRDAVAEFLAKRFG